MGYYAAVKRLIFLERGGLCASNRSAQSGCQRLSRREEVK